MEEILASIRRIIADGDALALGQGGQSGDGSRPEVNGRAFETAAQASPSLSSASSTPDGQVRAAFTALLASRLVQHSDAVMELTREMLRPMIKSWLDDNLPGIVERLVSAEIERLTRGE
jgi:cell pole-organizing protein PopZ